MVVAVGACWWPLVGRTQGCCKNRLRCTGQSPRQRIIPSDMLLVLRLRNLSLRDSRFCCASRHSESTYRVEVIQGPGAPGWRTGLRVGSRQKCPCGPVLSAESCPHPDLSPFLSKNSRNLLNTSQTLCIMCDWWVTFSGEFSLSVQVT